MTFNILGRHRINISSDRIETTNMADMQYKKYEGKRVAKKMDPISNSINDINKFLTRNQAYL